MVEQSTALILLLILCFAVVTISTIGTVNAESTIFVRVDGSVDGTEKIQRFGDIYMFTGNIEGSIIVENDNIVIDGSDYALQGLGTGRGIEILDRQNVTIRNIKITNFEIGVYIYDYSEPRNNTIHQNIITYTTYGLYIEHAHNNTILDNTITNNEYGIYLLESRFNVFKNNSLSNNHYNLEIHNTNFANDVDASNFVNGKPMIYWVNQQDRTVPYEAGYVALIECENITVQNLKLTNNGQSILLSSTKNTTIIRNIVKDNEVGIFVEDSTNITICENIIANNGVGIRIVGKFHAYSQNNRICENNITNNNIGIHIWESSNNTLFRNHLADNNYGIRINRLGGVAENNIIYNNNFINSTVDVPGYWHMVVFQEVWVPPQENVWNYKNEGNYWSDYTAKYPNATEVDDSGIWNISYVISENNQDNYALTNPLAIPEFSDEDEPTTPYEEFVPTTLLVASIVVAVISLGLVVYFKKRKH